MPNTTDMPNLIDMLEQGSEFIGDNSNLTEDKKQFFFWATMGALYFSNRIGGTDGFPTIETLDNQVYSANLKRQQNPISDEKKKKMLDFYQAVLANRAQLLAVQTAMLNKGNIPDFGLPPGERNSLKRGISDMLGDNNLKQKQLPIDQNTPHAKLIGKFQSRLSMLEVIDCICKFLGLPGFDQEVNEVQSYIQTLEEGAKKGISVSSLTDQWKNTNKNQQLFTNSSWLYSSNRTHSEVVQAEDNFLRPFKSASCG